MSITHGLYCRAETKFPFLLLKVRNEDEGDGSRRRYSRKLCLHAGIADAKLGPTVLSKMRIKYV